MLSALLALLAGCGKDSDTDKGKSPEGPGKSRDPTIAKFEKARVATAKVQLSQVADMAYSVWAMETGEQCPASLSALDKYTNASDHNDPWGNEMIMLCGEDAPAGGAGFAMLSKGPDGKRGTADDVKSWE